LGWRQNLACRGARYLRPGVLPLLHEQPITALMLSPWQPIIPVAILIPSFIIAPTVCRK
jgi:hypothetical protein